MPYRKTDQIRLRREDLTQRDAIAHVRHLALSKSNEAESRSERAYWHGVAMDAYHNLRYGHAISLAYRG